MKLMISLIVVMIVFFIVNTSAFSGDILEGTGTVDFIQMYEGDDPEPCELEITFTSAKSGSTYILPVTAEGSQLNLALLMAYEYNTSLDIVLDIILYPFEGKITSIAMSGD